jgi:trk system potassium uptake protein TrkA
VVARNYDPTRRLLYEAFGLQVVSSTSWGAQRIEELLYHQDIRSVFSAGNGEVEVYEVEVPATWQGRTLGELTEGQGLQIVAHSRAGRAEIAAPETRLETGDLLLVSATLEGITDIRARLARPEDA